MPWRPSSKTSVTKFSGLAAHRFFFRFGASWRYVCGSRGTRSPALAADSLRSCVGCGRRRTCVRRRFPCATAKQSIGVRVRMQHVTSSRGVREDLCAGAAQPTVERSELRQAAGGESGGESRSRAAIPTIGPRGTRQPLTGGLPHLATSTRLWSLSRIGLG